MSDLQLSVLVIDSNPEDAQTLANLVSFLDYNAIPVSHLDDLKEALAENRQVVAALFKVSQPLGFTQSAWEVLAANDTPISIYLIENGGEDFPFARRSRIKPLGALKNPNSYKELLAVLREAEMVYESKSGSGGESSSRLFRSLVGNSPQIQALRELIRQVSSSEASVLILGESGTGKEVVARNIHYYSPRRGKPFVPVNCGAIPAELLESELFGHEKGAFTGAISSRQGRFEMAEGGTLFLDEIGDMPLSMQVKLLRVLQERTFERVGSNKSIPADVRIIAATHQNLEQLVSEGKFRMDLYYRLNVFPIDVPSLRDRSGDIPMLIKEFITRSEIEKRGSVRLNDCAIAALSTYQWPGNVRELSNLIERLVILFPKELVRWQDLPEKFRPNDDWVVQLQEPVEESLKPPTQDYYSEPRLPKGPVDLKAYLEEIEEKMMVRALDEADWVVARAAKLLTLRRTTLVEKMKKYNLSREPLASEF